MKQSFFWSSVLLAGIFLIVFFAVFAFFSLSPQEFQEVSYQVKVDSYVGVNVASDKLYFGTLLPGDHASRSLSLHSDHRSFVVVRFADGGVADRWLVVDRNGFLLPADKDVSLQFSLRVPLNASLRTYEGRVVFLFFPPSARFFSWFL